MISDHLNPAEVKASEQVFTGRVWDVVRETLILQSGEQVVRDYIKHPGAVAVLAVNDLAQVLTIAQYRHPLGQVMYELPAGLLDVQGEEPLAAAQRELLEETGFTARTWRVLFDFANTPGGSSEVLRCYFAEGVEHIGRPTGEGEEKDMPVLWVPIGELVEAVRLGRVANPTLVTGVFALLAALADPAEFLRPPDAPWPTRTMAQGLGRTR